MRTLLIVTGAFLLFWVGYVQLHLNKYEERIEILESHHHYLDKDYEVEEDELEEDEIEDNEIVPEGSPIDETEDELDMKEDKFDQKFEMPYEEEETNENTNLKRDDNPLPKAENKDETDLSIREKLEKGVSLGVNDNAVVAFSNITDHLYRGEKSVEAFQLNHHEQEAIVAFKVR